MSSTPTTVRRVSGVAAAAAVLTLLAAGSSSAAPNHSVDPATLTPPPPDFFNAECRTAGRQILCDLAFVDPVSPVLEPTGIVCGDGPGAFELLDTSTRSVRGTRYYNADGLLLRRHFNDDWEGTLTNAVTGASVAYAQRGTYLHDLAVPGDSSTGIERDTTHLRAYSSTGAVLIDAGRVVRSLEDDAVLFQSGQHPIDDYFAGDTSVIQRLCDALG